MPHFDESIEERAFRIRETLLWRCHPDSDRGMKVLQTFALPLGYGTEYKNGAVDETRTRDLHLGKVALYQLSYYRIFGLERVMGIEPT